MTEQSEVVEERTVVEVPVDGRPVVNFEGEIVTAMTAKMPGVTVDMVDGYPRNTHLRMNVEFVVSGVRYVPAKGGGLVREHVLRLEAAHMVSAFAPEYVADDVGGSASGQAVPSAEESAELGVEIGRTSDTWEGRRTA